MVNEFETLFSSKIRPKVLRYLFQNEEENLNLKEMAARCQIKRKVLRKELNTLKKIKLIFEKTQKEKLRGKSKTNITYFIINPKFPFLSELKSLLFSVFPVSLKELKLVFNKVPQLKLLVAAGIFLGESKSPVDILIVLSKIQKSKISKLIKKIESNLGKEIRWCQMSIEEFNYREEMRDKFLKDTFDHRNQRIIDKIPSIKKHP